MKRFQREKWLALVERHRVTHCQMAPTMFHRLLALLREVRRGYEISSLEKWAVEAMGDCRTSTSRRSAAA